MKRQAIGTTALVLGLSFSVWAVPPALADCATTNLTDLFNQRLNLLMPAFNKKWPSMAQQKGLAPYDKGYSGDENLSCEYGGDEVCGLQLSGCKKEYVSVDLTEITGIQNMNMTSISTDQASLVSSCPYGTAKGNYTCNYAGVATAYFSDSNVGFDLKSAEAKAECQLGGIIPVDFTEPIYNTHGICSVGSIGVTATLDVCIGGPTGPAIISYTGLKRGSAKVQSSNSKFKSNRGYRKRLTVAQEDRREESIKSCLVYGNRNQSSEFHCDVGISRNSR